MERVTCSVAWLVFSVDIIEGRIVVGHLNHASMSGRTYSNSNFVWRNEKDEEDDVSNRYGRGYVESSVVATVSKEANVKQYPVLLI